MPDTLVRGGTLGELTTKMATDGDNHPADPATTRVPNFLFNV